MARPTTTVTTLAITSRDELVPVKATHGFRVEDAVHLVTKLEDRRESMRVKGIIPHVALIVDRWEANSGPFGRGAAVEVIGRAK